MSLKIKPPIKQIEIEIRIIGGYICVDHMTLQHNNQKEKKGRGRQRTETREDQIFLKKKIIGKLSLQSLSGGGHQKLPFFKFAEANLHFDY